MPTSTDTDFAARFPDMTVAGFLGNEASLEDWLPTPSSVMLGAFSDIGRQATFGPDRQLSFWQRYMISPMTRGDSVLSSRVGEVSSHAYDPDAPDSALFSGSRPDLSTITAKKNFSRQTSVEVFDALLKQFVQTDDMIGDIMAEILGTSMACYLDDMWTASKEFFSGTMTPDGVNLPPKAGQSKVLTTSPGDEGFADEMVEAIWDFSQNKFAFKSALYNPSGYNTKSQTVDVALVKDIQYPAFKKLYADTFNPAFINLNTDMDYVDSFATPYGAPEGAGELLGMVIDRRAFAIHPLPDSMATEVFRNPARRSSTYFMTYEYVFETRPFFNVGWIFAPAGE